MDVRVTDDRPPVPDPAAEPAAGPGWEPEPEPAPEVDEGTVREALEGIGDLAHGLLGDRSVPEHWGFTDAELAALSPSLTRLLARHAWARSLVGRAPILIVVALVVKWGRRNLDLSRRLREDREAAETRPEEGPDQVWG